MKQEKYNYTVYKHTTPSGKIYIGITKNDVQKRFNGGYGYRHNEYFFNAIKKYGWDNIKHEIIASGLNEQEACNLEIELIAEYKSTEKEHGYNIESGGRASKLSDETKEKIKKSRIGTKHDQKTKDKMKVSRKRFLEKNPDYYKQKSHLIDNMVEKAILKNSKQVLQFDLNGNLLFKWSSIREAERKTNINRVSVRRCCQNIYKTAGGFVWRYLTEENYETRNRGNT